jgi:tetratricopeptide (TPR) repeat protein
MTLLMTRLEGLVITFRNRRFSCWSRRSASASSTLDSPRRRTNTLPPRELCKVSDAHRARIFLGFAYFHVGMHDEARTAFEAARARQPRERNTVGGVVLSRFAAGDTLGAIAYADSLWRAWPDTSLTWARLGEAHFMAGHYEEAERFLAGALAMNPNSTNQYTARSTALPLAAIYAQTGRPELLPPLLETAWAYSDDGLAGLHEPWNEYYSFAALTLIQGDADGAIRWLRTAHEAGMPGAALIARDPALRPLHDDPRFHDIVERLRHRGDEIRRRIREKVGGEKAAEEMR